MSMTLAEIAQRLNGEVIGDGALPITGFAPTDAAKAGDLTFAESDPYLAKAEQSAASAILVSDKMTSASKALIRVPNARVGYAKVLPLFFPEPTFVPGVHPNAVVSKTASIDATAHIGPFCVIGDNVKVGPRCVLESGNHIGDGCVLGEDVRLFPSVVISARSQIGNRVRIHAGTVIGADGFSYVFDEGRHLKVPQIGNVIIQDDVEIGANTAVDRAALGSTVIGKGTKIDNLVQVAHNVVLGDHCVLCGQVGIAGSTKVGSYVTMAGQVGVAPHLKVGSRVTLGAQSGVMTNVPDGERWLYAPAQPERQVKRMIVAMQRLPELLQRVNKLEKAQTQSSEKREDAQS